MTPEMWTIIGVGIAIASLILASNRQLSKDLSGCIERVEASVSELRERMAHLEGLLEGLREAITRNRAA